MLMTDRLESMPEWSKILQRLPIDPCSQSCTDRSLVPVKMAQGGGARGFPRWVDTCNLVEAVPDASSLSAEQCRPIVLCLCDGTEE